MTEKEDYDLIDVHNQIQKYYNKLLNEKDNILQTIYQYVSIMINKKMPYGAEKSTIDSYIEKYKLCLSKNEDTNIKEYNKNNEENKNNKIKLVSYKDWKDICNKIKEYENQIEQVDITLPYLLATIDPIIKNYSEELKKPIISTFLGSKSNHCNEKCIQYYDEYINTSKDILGDELLYKIIKKGPKLNISSISSLCITTNINNNTYEQDYDGGDDFFDNNKVQYDDIGRVNLNQRYKYERKIHFRDTLQQFQGTQNRQINEKVYKDLEDMIIKHSLVDIKYEYNDIKRFHKVTKEHIRIFLSECGYYSHYEDAQLIYTKLTGKPAPNISKYEKELYNDFDELVGAFMKLPEDIRKNRKNFLNNKYVLNQLLKRRNIRVPEADLDSLKTPSRRREHDEIYSLCCNILGWNFTPLN